MKTSSNPSRRYWQISEFDLLSVPYTGKKQGADCRPQEEVNAMIFTVVLLLIVGSILLPSIKASFSSKSDIIPEQLELNSVRDALMEKHGWSLERAEAARVEYI